MEGDGVGARDRVIQGAYRKVGLDRCPAVVALGDHFPAFELVCILRVRRLLRLFARRGRRLSVLDHLHVADQCVFRVEEAHLEHLWVLFVLRLDGQIGLDRCPAVVALGDHFPAVKHIYAVLFFDRGIFDLGRDRRGAEGHRHLFALLSFKPPFECDGARLERALDHRIDDEVGLYLPVCLVPSFERLDHALFGRDRGLDLVFAGCDRRGAGRDALGIDRLALDIELDRIGALLCAEMSIDRGVGRDRTEIRLSAAAVQPFVKSVVICLVGRLDRIRRHRRRLSALDIVAAIDDVVDIEVDAIPSGVIVIDRVDHPVLGDKAIVVVPADKDMIDAEVVRFVEPVGRRHRVLAVAHRLSGRLPVAVIERDFKVDILGGPERDDFRVLGDRAQFLCGGAPPRESHLFAVDMGKIC